MLILAHFEMECVKPAVSTSNLQTEKKHKLLVSAVVPTSTWFLYVGQDEEILPVKGAFAIGKKS